MLVITEDEEECTVISVKNTASYFIPETGGSGNLIYKAGGALIILAAILLCYIIIRRRKECNHTP